MGYRDLEHFAARGWSKRRWPREKTQAERWHAWDSRVYPRLSFRIGETREQYRARRRVERRRLRLKQRRDARARVVRCRRACTARRARG